MSGNIGKISCSGWLDPENDETHSCCLIPLNLLLL